MSKIDKKVIEYCKCFYSHELLSPACGCGLSHLNRHSTIVHYQGFHWDAICALQDLNSRLETSYGIINIIDNSDDTVLDGEWNKWGIG